jgi:hypothetical protein
MTRDREILVIGTYGIDVFYGIVEQMELNGYIAFTCSSPVIAREYLNNRRFDAIIINLEPDGKGGVAEIDLLDTIANARLQQEAVCLGVSAHYPHSLPSARADKHLKILAGWLTLPVVPKILAEHIIKLLEAPDRQTVSTLRQG